MESYFEMIWFNYEDRNDGTDRIGFGEVLLVD